MKIFELQATDGTRLSGSIYESEKPKDILFWIHGFADHKERFAHLGKWMAERGTALALVDLRGHGHSDGKRGYIKSFEEYFQDVTALLTWGKENFPSGKFFLGAHSMGGLVAIRYLQEKLSPVLLQGVVVTSPLVAFGTPVPFLKKMLGDILFHLAPELAIPSGISPDTISHDDAINQAYKNDPLVFKTVTSSWYHEILKNQKIVLEKKELITLPFLLLQGTGDKLVSPEASRNLFEEIGSTNKEFVPYEDLYHEILNESIKEEIFQKMHGWLQKN